MQTEYEKDKNNCTNTKKRFIFKEQRKQKYIIKGFEFMINKDLSKEECLLLLPTEAFDIFTYISENIVEETNLQTYGNFNKIESYFFKKLVQVSDENEHLIFIHLLKILKGDRIQKKQCFNKLNKILSSSIVIEKIILFLLSFELKNQIYKKIIKLLSNVSKFYTRELLFLFAIFTYHENCKDEAINGIQNIIQGNFHNFINLIQPDINDNFFKLKSKLVAISILNFGYLNNLNFFNKSINNNYRIKVFLDSHLYVFTFANDFVEDYITDATSFIKTVCKMNNLKHENIILNLISHLASKDLFLIEDNKFFFEYYFSKLQLNFNESLLRVLSYLARNDQKMSIELFTIIKYKKDLTQNIVKVLNILVENLDYNDVVNYTLEHLFELLSGNFNKSHSFFSKILPCIKLENEMSNLLLDEKCKEAVLKIFVYIVNNINDNNFKENLFILIKNDDHYAIKNLSILLDKIGKDKFYFYKIFELAKQKIFKNSLSEKIIYGYLIFENILNKIDKQYLMHVGHILYEKIEITEDTSIIQKFSLLSKIYEICSFKIFSELILELSPYLKIKNLFIKEHIINFLVIILKKNINIQHNVNKLEFLRICYEIAEYLSICYFKNTRAVDLICQLSNFVPPQEIVNICTEFFGQNTKKGLINALSKLSKDVGCFNVLPVLLVDYKYTQHKLLIVKIISTLELDIKCLNIITPLLEDCLLKKEIVFRVLGLKLLTLIIKNSIHIDFNIIFHFINLSWFNILEENIEIRKNFDDLIASIVKKFGADYLYKYVIIGIHHPSKKIRKRYLEIYEIIKINGMFTFSFTNQLWYR